MLAGPSEILVLADDSAIAEWVAADMLSQAEHDALASAICVTDSARLADMLKQSLTQQLVDLPRSAEATASLKDWGAIIVTPDMALAMEISNMIAPEHLELAVRDPWLLLPLVRHAGAIFLGHFCPEAIGDYFAGPNHVLPTMGTARFSSALSVQTFCKKSSIISASHAFTCSNASGVARLARLEGLEAHARSVETRIRR
jgi:histidinol dehydrogenase